MCLLLYSLGLLFSLSCIFVVCAEQYTYISFLPFFAFICSLRALLNSISHTKEYFDTAERREHICVKYERKNKVDKTRTMLKV